MAIKYIVTGGAGFIGRNLVAELNRRGEDDILIVDSLGTEDKWRNLRGLRFEDMIDKDDFRIGVAEGDFTEARVVLHEGACSATTEQDADYLLDNNYRYTRELCLFCLAHDIRFVYASSAATYGDGANGYSDHDDMTPKLRPLNMYGFSKQLFDLWALKHRLFDRIAGLKYFNVYGPHEEHKGDMRSMVHKAYGQVSEHGNVNLFRSYRPDYADGEQQRDFLYVNDAVDVTLWFGENPDRSGLFNCGTGEARTWNDLAAAVFAAMGREQQIIYVDMPDVLQDKYQYFTQADMRKLRDAGYDRPFTSIEDGVTDYVQTYLATPDGP
jgi:ADP-L-glycero-D-manno-heptose 6-epimerase